MIKKILVPLDGSEHSKAAPISGLACPVSTARSWPARHRHRLLEGTFFHDISGSLGFEPYLDFSTKMREIFDERGKLVLENFARSAPGRYRCQTFSTPG